MPEQRRIRAELYRKWEDEPWVAIARPYKPGEEDVYSDLRNWYFYIMGLSFSLADTSYLGLYFTDNLIELWQRRVLITKNSPRLLSGKPVLAFYRNTETPIELKTRTRWNLFLGDILTGAIRYQARCGDDYVQQTKRVLRSLENGPNDNKRSETALGLNLMARAIIEHYLDPKKYPLMACHFMRIPRGFKEQLDALNYHHDGARLYYNLDADD